LVEGFKVTLIVRAVLLMSVSALIRRTECKP